MKHGMLLTGTCVLCLAGSALADESVMDRGTERYQAHEFNVDAFGSASIGQTTIEHLSGSRIRDNGRLGAGAGVSYFFTRNIGVGVDAYSADANHHFVDSASANLIVRFPLGDSGLSPYVLGGGGRQFDPTKLWFAQAGAGWSIASPGTWGCSPMVATSSQKRRRTTACSALECASPFNQPFSLGKNPAAVLVR